METVEEREYLDRIKEITLKCIKGPGLTRKFMSQSSVDPEEMMARMISSIFFLDSVVCALKDPTGLTEAELSEKFVECSKLLGDCDMMTATHFLLRGAMTMLTKQYTFYEIEKMN